MSRRPSLRTRLLVALVSVSVGVLVVAGITGLLAVRATVQRSQLEDLRRRADDLSARADEATATLRRSVGATGSRRNPFGEGAEVRRALNDFRDSLQLGDARVVFLDASGAVVPLEEAGPVGRRLASDPTTAELFALPSGVSDEDIDPQRLLRNEEVSGRTGDTLFLAQPIGRVITAAPGVSTAVIVGTERAARTGYGRAGVLFLFAAGLTLLACIVVSFLLARRLTRTLTEIEHTARRLAVGDLSARAEIAPGTEDELATVAQALNAMAGELEATHASQRAFLLSVSHDLRTPLTSIRGYADALADGTIDAGDDEARSRAAAVISAEARRLERLVRDLLDLSRLDSRQFSLRPRPCDAAEVVQEAAAAFGPAANDLAITLDVVGASHLSADLDPERLGQVVANLIENALKYATTTVTVEVDGRDDGILVAVVDDGPGIPADELPRVFERLYTVRATPGRSVGTGLGLAIVHELAAAMGGTATATGTPGSGSRFEVRLPRGAAGHPLPV